MTKWLVDDEIGYIKEVDNSEEDIQESDWRKPGKMRLDEDLTRSEVNKNFMEARMDKEEDRRKNFLDQKGGKRPKLPWLKYDTDEIVQWLYIEIGELKNAIDEEGTPEQVRDECKDVANMCNFLYENLEGKSECIYPK